MKTSDPLTRPPASMGQTAPRGFIIDRSDGQPQLPGSLHTNRRLDRWLSFAEPGVVTAYTGKAELGQGILTALRVVVADELDVALERVRVQSASTVRGPDEAVTSGSLSVQDSATALRHACAEVRFLAAARAAERVGVPAEQVSVQDGRFIDSRGATIGDYWEALAGMDLGREFSGLSKPKPPERRTLIGRADHPRADLPDKVFGRRRFIQDLRMPGMLHARVLRPPTLSAQLESDPEPLLAALPARVRVLLDGRFIALIGPSEHEVDRAAESLRAALRWSSPELLPDGNDLARFLKSAPRQTTLSAQRGCGEAHEGTPLETWPEGGTRFSADYLKPYLAHASIGPSCAMACWSAGRLEVWTHSQGIHNLRDDLVLALAHEPDAPARESIAVHHVEGAGCYGHNGADDVAFDAVLCARFCPGVPVRVMWSRADELRHSPFGAAQAVRLEARLDDAGNISHWHHEIWANGYSSRPGRAKTPTLLAASERAVATPVLPAVNPPLATGGGSDRNAVPGYAISDYRVINHRLTVMPLRTSAMRALGGYANVFAIESFVDEMAWAIGEDPVAFRRRHIRDERALAVIDGVISRSTWWAAPMDTGSGFGRGLGWARYKNSGAWCAAIAHVQVTDRVKVMAIDLAVDVGMVVDLDGVMNQIEGGAIQSASWTTMEQVRFDRHAIQSVGWDTYPIMRFGDVPQLRVHVLDRPDQPPLGAGEAAQGPVAAAIANAVAQALGVRIRELPLDPERLLRAVHAA